MKAKNRFWTLIFAFVPGAGQMYQGYMKRGLVHITLFCVSLGLGILTGGILAILMPIIWMYSFFDTFTLRSQLMEGCAPADDYPIRLEDTLHLERFVQSSHKLLGWALVFAGLYSLYFVAIRPLGWYFNDMGLYWLSDLIWDVPSLVMAFILIVVGVRLVRGKKPAPAPQDYPDYTAEEADHGAEL